MNTNRISRRAGFALMTWTAVSVTAGDCVITRAGEKISAEIVRLAAAGVSLSGGQNVPWTNVSGLRRDRAPLQAPGQRLVLRNGTELSGLLRRATSELVVFRGVTSGEIEVAWTNVSRIRFETGGLPLKSGSNWTGVFEIVKTDGVTRGGKIMAATRRQILLRTADGLEKFDAGDVAWLIAGPPPLVTDAVTLRNGDRLCGPPAWRNENLLADVYGKSVEVDQSAIQAIDFAVNAEKGRE